VLQAHAWTYLGAAGCFALPPRYAARRGFSSIVP
jgi:hypothetical protein